MATYTTSTAVGAREDLSNVISRSDPDETPLVSNAKVETTKGIFHEWQVSELAAAVDTNSASEGGDFSYTNPNPTIRLGNYHQIAVQAASVSNTLDVVDKAGRDKETAYVKVTKAIEQRRDINKSMYKNEARSASEPRKTGKLTSWITNVDFSTAGTTSAVSAGTGADAATLSGNDRALSLALIDNAMELAYTDGGKPSMMVVSPKNKVAFSDLSSGSAVTNQLHMTANAPQDAVIVGSVSLYLTDFGQLNVVIDRAAPNSEIYLMDPDHYSIGHLPGRMYSVSDVAPVGDATRFAIVSEYCLIMRAPKAHGAVFDLSTS